MCCAAGGGGGRGGRGGGGGGGGLSVIDVHARSRRPDARVCGDIGQRRPGGGGVTIYTCTDDGRNMRQVASAAAPTPAKAMTMRRAAAAALAAALSAICACARGTLFYQQGERRLFRLARRRWLAADQRLARPAAAALAVAAAAVAPRTAPSTESSTPLAAARPAA